MTHTHTLTLLFEFDLLIYTITIHIPADTGNFKPSGIYDFFEQTKNTI